ncbi:MAG: cell wall hydrolase [Geminicoccaceae bacterium]
MARTILGEARGEGELGMTAVAWVIRNRAANPRWWGRSVTEVCKKPFQFSCWLKGDKNYKLVATDAFALHPLARKARQIAQSVLSGSVPDPTNGADHYRHYGVDPAWDDGHQPVASIGAHRFYRLEI